MYNISPKTLIVGKQINYLPTCHSTNAIAHEYFSESCPDGTIIITSNQTAGKGQRGNIWESAPGLNLTFSIILYPNFLSAINQFFLSKMISLAIIDVLTTKIGEKIKIKWPNDIYFENKKLGGILIENTLLGNKIKGSIIGVGLNINQTTFAHQQAISLINITNTTNSLPDVLQSIIEAIDKRYTQLSNNNFNLISTQYESRLLGKNIVRKFKSDYIFDGKIVGVDDDGRLKIIVNDQILRFNFKEVEYLFES